MKDGKGAARVGEVDAAMGPEPVAAGKIARTERLGPVSPRAAAASAAAPSTNHDATTAAPRDDPFGLHLPATVQLRGDPAGPTVADDSAVREAAATGVAGPGAALPFLDRLQASFTSDHDLSGVRAHVGGPAARASEQIGARAYATGNDVAFGETPDLHTAAHEAAHVVQQRGGVHLKGGVGEAGDPYERNADAVADRVVRGEPAGDLLAGYAANASAAASLVQRVDKPVPDLGANQRVLSRDPAYTTDAFLPWFRDQVKTKITAWGLVFAPAAVTLKTVKLDGASVKAVVLDWDAAWGALPMTRDFPLTMSPVDARAAITAVKALKGWSKVAADEQGIITNVLGAEENQLSSSTRDHLRPTFLALKGKTDDEQATALKGVLQTKTAAPGWAAEHMDAAIATVALTGPTAKKDYDFRGKKADGEEWIAAFSDGVSVNIVAPKAPTPGHHNHSVQDVANAARFLPKAARSLITLIMLNPIVNPEDAHWAVEYHKPDFHSYMTAGVAGVVTIYPDKATNPLPNDDGRRSAMVHETAHTWSYKTWGEDTAKGKWLDWKTAMTADKVAVSGYATSAIAEDVAETVRVYASTKGTTRFAEYDKIVPKRFAILKTEYK